MTENIDERISFLKSEFSEILFLKQENAQLFEKSHDKIVKLREWYNNYITENQNHLFIFGLDSFHYQGKIIDVEYDDMKRLYCSITNRIYCEYYKLYQIIVKYTEDVVKDKKVTDVVMSNNNFPKYMDLEPYKQYGVETITQIHDIIMLLFSSVKSVIDKKHDELNSHRAKNRIGINIDNFIQAFHFEIIIVEQKLSLFISYMEFFHKMSIKYLKRFTSKMTLFFGQIDHDIRMDTASKTKERRKTMMEEFKHDNIDTRLMNELTESITSSISDIDNGDSSSSDESTTPITLKNNNSRTVEPIDILEPEKINTSVAYRRGKHIDNIQTQPDINIVPITQDTQGISKRETNIEVSVASRLFSEIQENPNLDDLQSNTSETASCIENIDCNVEPVDDVAPENTEEVSALSNQNEEIIQDIIPTTQEDSSFENNENEQKNGNENERESGQENENKQESKQESEQENENKQEGEQENENEGMTLHVIENNIVIDTAGNLI